MVKGQVGLMDCREAIILCVLSAQKYTPVLPESGRRNSVNTQQLHQLISVAQEYAPQELWSLVLQYTLFPAQTLIRLGRVKPLSYLGLGLAHLWETASMTHEVSHSHFTTYGLPTWLTGRSPLTYHQPKNLFS